MNEGEYTALRTKLGNWDIRSQLIYHKSKQTKKILEGKVQSLQTVNEQFNEVFKPVEQSADWTLGYRDYEQANVIKQGMPEDYYRGINACYQHMANMEAIGK